LVGVSNGYGEAVGGIVGVVEPGERLDAHAGEFMLATS